MNQRAPKQCPICRQLFSRVTQHIRLVHGVHGEEMLHLQAKERERCAKTSEMSHDISSLWERFPNSYLQVALFLIDCHQPVYERPSRNGKNAAVRHLSAADIVQRLREDTQHRTSFVAKKMSATVPGRAEAAVQQGLAQSETSSRTSRTHSAELQEPAKSVARNETLRTPSAQMQRPARSETVRTPSADVQEPAQSATRKENNNRTAAVLKAPVQSETRVITERSQPTTQGAHVFPPLRRSPRCTVRSSLDTSAESDVARPKKKRRVASIIYSSSSSESSENSDDESDDESNLGVRDTFIKRYQKVNMYMSNAESNAERNGFQSLH